MKLASWKVGSIAALLAMAAWVGGAWAETATYTYDVFGRLSTVTWSSGVVVTYSYDANDNRTSVVISGGQNNNPVANNDNITVTKNVAYNFDPRTNDTDANGDTLTISAKTNGAHGTVTITGGGTGLTYTPATNYTGSDSFTYTLTDGHGGTSAPATVSVTVQVPTLTASAPPGTWSWDQYINDPPIYDSNITCAGSGGTGSYTYHWSYVSGDTGASVNAPNSASTSWTRSVSGFNTWTSIWRCTVTDSASATATVDVTVTFTRES